MYAANLVEMDIQTLTTMLMGYKRPTFLYECGRIKTEYYMLKILEQLIPVEKPYFQIISKFKDIEIYRWLYIIYLQWTFKLCNKISNYKGVCDFVLIDQGSITYRNK